MADVSPRVGRIVVAATVRWSVVRRMSAVAFAAAAFTAGTASTAAGAQPRNDFAVQAYDVLPPGEDGGVPVDPNSTSQLPLYDGLTPLEGHVTASDLSVYFKSEHFGIAGPVARSESTGRAGLTILRDGFDVPHIYGRTRDDVMFGSGWVAAEDRGLLMEERVGRRVLQRLTYPDSMASSC